MRTAGPEQITLLLDHPGWEKINMKINGFFVDQERFPVFDNWEVVLFRTLVVSRVSLTLGL